MDLTHSFTTKKLKRGEQTGLLVWFVQDPVLFDACFILGGSVHACVCLFAVDDLCTQRETTRMHVSICHIRKLNAMKSCACICVYLVCV